MKKKSLKNTFLQIQIKPILLYNYINYNKDNTIRLYNHT
jgi:hypothetical protein